MGELLTALRTRIYRCIARKYGGRLHASSLRPGYFGGDEAALQQHSNGATFRRRSFREWPRAPTHSGRRLTREASSRYSSSDEQISDDCRRFQSQYHSRLSANALVSIVHWNSIIYGLRLPFGRKYVHELRTKNSIDCRNISSAALWPQPGLRACTSGTHAPA